jgi:hypothetical protein
VWWKRKSGEDNVKTGVKKSDGDEVERRSRATGSVIRKTHDRFSLSGMLLIPNEWESYIP